MHSFQGLRRRQQPADNLSGSGKTRSDGEASLYVNGFSWHSVVHGERWACRAGILRLCSSHDCPEGTAEEIREIRHGDALPDNRSWLVGGSNHCGLLIKDAHVSRLP